MRLRQVHLDFHTGEHIPDVGREFNKEQFQEALKVGHVDSITAFSLCHYGCPSESGGSAWCFRRKTFLLARMEMWCALRWKSWNAIKWWRWSTKNRINGTFLGYDCKITQRNKELTNSGSCVTIPKHLEVPHIAG